MEAAIRADDIHQPPTALICLENTHNRAGGAVIPLAAMQSVYALAVRHGLPLHLDGARIFNAAIALGVAAKEIAACATTVQFCLSKGLGAPIGSLIAGPRIGLPRRAGASASVGGMPGRSHCRRGIVALETMVIAWPRIAPTPASWPRAGGAARPGADPAAVETNIVIFKTTALLHRPWLKPCAGGTCSASPWMRRGPLTTHKDEPCGHGKALAIVKDALRQA